MRSRWLGPALIAGMMIFGIAVYNWLPEQVDSHWNAAGEADDTMGRFATIVLTPAIALGTWLLLAFLPRIDPKRDSYSQFQGSYWLIVNAIILFMTALQVLILVNGLGLEVSVVRVIMVGVGLLFAVLGNELGRVRPNWFMGIRTPWTLSDPEVWRRTHRVGGRVFFRTGLLIALGGLLLPLTAATILLIVAITGVSIGLVVYSYLLWRQEQVGSS